MSQRLLPQTRGEMILAGFLIARLSLVMLALQDPSGGVLIDSRGYLGLTERLWSSGVYWVPDNPEPDLLRPPGYSIVLYLIRAILGSSVTVIVAVQLLATGLASWALLLLGRRLEREGIGRFAAWALALSPNLALWSLTVMTEVWLASLMVISLFLVVEDIQHYRVKWPVYSGILLGVASYFRPIAVIMLPVWSYLGFVWARWKGSNRKAIGSVLGLIALCTVVMVPWAIRNWKVHDQFLFSTVTSKTWQNFILADVLSESEGISRDEAAARIEDDESILLVTAKIIRDHPVVFIRSQMFGIVRTMVGLDTGTWGNVLDHDEWVGLGLLSALFGEAGEPDSDGLLSMVWSDGAQRLKLLIMLISILYSFLLVSSVILGIVAVQSQERDSQFLFTFAGATALVLVLTPLAAGQARFRVPAEPFLALMGGYGWEWLRSKTRSTKSRISIRQNSPVGADAVRNGG